MGKPTLLVVDDDARLREAISRDLTRRFGADYSVEVVESSDAALERLRRMKELGDELALLLADQWLPGLTGVDLLHEVQHLYPGAQRGVLVAYGDWSTVGPLQQAATLGYIDFFVFKPWADPDEWLFPMIGDYLSRWARTHRPRFEAITVVGEQWAPRSHDIRDRLERNAIPFGFYAHDSPEGQRILAAHHLDTSRLPVVTFFSGQVLVDPSNSDLARAFGVATQPGDAVYDVAIVGAGPAGLSAAVYAASEGLNAVVLEHRSLGGQAGSTSLIRNYLGFPFGLRGDDLTTRAYQQALLLGANFVFATLATGLTAHENGFVVALERGGQLRASTFVIATGVDYRSTGVPSIEALTGTGVFYGAAVTEARAMYGQRVAVVGGGNSAGQAAIYLAKYAQHVTLVVRGDDLAANMSDYLIRELSQVPNIEVRLRTAVVDAVGSGRLDGLRLRDLASGAEETIPAVALFLLIGGEPRTDWLGQTVRRDNRGYVLTGTDLMHEGAWPAEWPLARPPLIFETSLPGVFAVGDVRARSVKRVASAVGEGSVVVHLVHQRLQELRRAHRESGVGAGAA